jgi:hypothetical protein
MPRLCRFVGCSAVLSQKFSVRCPDGAKRNSGIARAEKAAAEPAITARAQLRSSMDAHSRDPLASIRATLSASADYRSDV